MPLSFAEQILEFSERCERAISNDQLCALTQSLVRPLGYTAVASGRLGEIHPSEAMHFHNWNADWMAHYVRMGFMRVDPVPNWAMQSGMPITVAELRRRLPKGHPAHAVLNDAAHYGYTGGYVIPQRSADNTMGLVSIVGDADPQTPAERALLRTLAAIVFERAETLAGRTGISVLPMPIPKLSDRETECLKHLVHGLATDEIARRMDVSEATIRFHTANLRTKTASRNRAELVKFALVAGFGPGA